jgi:transglutaminase-like putative cysteine protease
MTLGYMQAMAVSGSKDLEVRSAAIEALDRAAVADHDPLSALAAIFSYVRDRVRFVHDPVGTQAVQSPRATLGLGAGNCAQRATLLAAMARSIGIPAGLKFRVAAADPRFPRSFSHVYVVATVRGRQIPLDPTYRENAFGYEYPRALRVGDFAL